MVRLYIIISLILILTISISTYAAHVELIRSTVHYSEEVMPGGTLWINFTVHVKNEYIMYGIRDLPKEFNVTDSSVKIICSFTHDERIFQDMISIKSVECSVGIMLPKNQSIGSYRVGLQEMIGSDVMLEPKYITVNVKYKLTEKPSIPKPPSREGEEEIEKPRIVKREKIEERVEEVSTYIPFWEIITIVGVACAVFLMFILMVKGRVVITKPAIHTYYLVTDWGSLKITDLDRVFGREDFEKILPEEKLIYISRREVGGQFRIFFKENKHYIVNLSSKNITTVNNKPALEPTPLSDGDVIAVTENVKIRYRRAL